VMPGAQAEWAAMENFSPIGCIVTIFLVEL